jgi:phosphoribosyl-AMP cyclohydrolase
MTQTQETPPPRSRLDPAVADQLKRDAAGLVAAVVQQYDSGEVLMLGWMDDVALGATLSTGRATFYSRSRQEYWVKGETSGHRQWVKEVRLDCDGDTLLVKVDQEGAACHTGDRTCFDARVLPVVVGERPTAEVAAGEPAVGPLRQRSSADASLRVERPATAASLLGETGAPTGAP